MLYNLDFVKRYIVEYLMVEHDDLVFPLSLTVLKDSIYKVYPLNLLHHNVTTDNYVISAKEMKVCIPKDVKISGNIMLKIISSDNLEKEYLIFVPIDVDIYG